MMQVLPVMLALIGVIALMIGAMFGLKWLTKRVSFKGNAGMRIIAALSLGQDKALYAIEAGSRKLLIGAGSGGLSLICELSEEDIALIKGSSEDMSGKSFSEILRHNMKKMGGEFIRPYQKDDSGDRDN